MARNNKTLIGIVSILVLLSLFSISVESLSYCPVLESTNATGQGVSTLRGYSFSNGFNGSDTAQFWQNQGGTTLNAAGRSFNVTVGDWFPNTTISLVDTARTLTTPYGTDVYFNTTGNNTWDMTITDNDGSLFFYYWTGSEWRNETSTTATGFAGTARNRPHAVTMHNLEPSNYTVLAVVNSSANGFGFWELKGRTWTKNDTFRNGIKPWNDDTVHTFVYNLTRNNRWNFIFAEVNTNNWNYYEWNGSIWNNVTTPYFANQTTSTSIKVIRWVYNTPNSRGNFTAWNLDTATSVAQSGFGTVLGHKDTSSSYNTTDWEFGRDINVTVGASGLCRVVNFTIESNVSGINTNITTITANNSVGISNMSTNLSLGINCNRNAGFKIYFGDKSSSFSNLTLPSIQVRPFIYNSTASASSNPLLTCQSRNNATLTNNKSESFNFVVNMSSVILGTNRTCEYGALNVDRVENQNKSNGCSVLVWNANLTTTQNITLAIAPELSTGGVRNLPAAIAAASIVTLIITYAISRTRRS